MAHASLSVSLYGMQGRFKCVGQSIIYLHLYAVLHWQ